MIPRLFAIGVSRTLIFCLGLAEFVDPEPVLATLRDALTQQYQRTNANAAANSHLKARADGVFHIATPAAED